MEKIANKDLTSALIKAFVFAIGVGVLFVFTRTVITVVLLFFLAMVFAMILNAPVTWLEKKKIPRAWGTFLLLFLIVLIVSLVSWLIVPMVGVQLKNLINTLAIGGSLETTLMGGCSRCTRRKESDQLIY